MSTYILVTNNASDDMKASARDEYAALDAAWDYAKHAAAERIEVYEHVEGFEPKKIGHIERVLEDV